MDLTRRAFLKGALAAAAVGAGSIAHGGSPKTGKKILILGGTSFLGPALVEAARARGHTLTLFNRGKTNPGLFPDVEQLHGDRDGHLEALKGRSWDAVVDTSGYVPRHVKDSATLLGPSVKRYIFVSTISVYADTSKPIDEDSPVAKLKAPSEQVTNETYGALKALCEQAAEQAMPGRVATVRPGLIVGPRDPSDRFTYWPVRLARGGEVLAPGNEGDPVQWIDVRDLAVFILGLVEKDTTGRFNALGPAKPTGVAELLAGCKQGTGSTATLTWVPADFLDKQKVAPWMDLPVWVPPVGETAYMGRIANQRAIAAGLAFRPVADTAKDTLAWWNSLPAERRAKPRAGLSPEREKAALAAWRAKKA